MENNKKWLVYLLESCEQGAEGWSGWMYYCIAFGNTDEEIYNNWLKNVKKVYEVDLSKNLRYDNGNWTCYYDLYKVELKNSIYGHSKPIDINYNFEKHIY